MPSDPLALYQSLSALRADGTRVYSVHDLNLRRDVLNFTFAEGRLAFLQPLGGRVTGIVFAGRGHVIATPHERGERRSLAQFLGVPILDMGFSSAYIRFTDDTALKLSGNCNSMTPNPPRIRISRNAGSPKLRRWGLHSRCG